MELKDKRLLGYDFEVFKYDWLLVTKDFDTEEKTIIHNDLPALRRYYDEHQSDIWVGYNSREYDQYILKGLLLNMDVWELNTQLIGGRRGWQIIKDQVEYPLYNFDIMTDKMRSLKELEGFMGSTIKESDVPFDIDRPLTPLELEETIFYCTHDVDETHKVFNARREEFEAQAMIIEMFDLPLTCFNKTKAQLAAIVLGAERGREHRDEFKLEFADTLQIGEKYQNIMGWYQDPRNMNYKRSLVTDVGGIPSVFAWGGLHAARANYFDDGILLHCDVASLYPSLMIVYDWLSRNVREPEKFAQMKARRLELKRAKDPSQLPLKILINATYGTLKDERNAMYDPRNANNVCVNGQLLILDLIEKIEPLCFMIQYNTDGLIIKVENEEQVERVREVAAEWEARTHLDLEWDRITKIAQKDVNNYIVLYDNGKIESKGAYVKPLSDIDYDLAIVNEALKAKLLYNTPIADTILSCDDFRKFQKIVKISGLYRNAVHGDAPIKEKVLRVYATKDTLAPSVMKVKSAERIEKIANTPDNCVIYNDSVLGAPCPNWLDKEYYVAMAEKRYADFVEPRNKTVASMTKSEIKFVSNDAVTYVERKPWEYRFSQFWAFAVSAVEEKVLTKRRLAILAEMSYFTELISERGAIEMLKVLDELKWGAAKLLKQPSDDVLDVIQNMGTVEQTKAGAYNLTPLDISQILTEIEVRMATRYPKRYTVVERVARQLQYAGRVIPTGNEHDRPLLYITGVRELCRRKDNKQFGYAIETLSIGSGRKSEMTVFNRTAKGKAPREGMIVRCLDYEYDGSYWLLKRYEVVE